MYIYIMKGDSRNDNLKSAKSGAIGNKNYITQPRSSVATVAGEVVISRNYPYKRRFQ